MRLLNKTNETTLLKTSVFTVVKKTYNNEKFEPIGLNCKDWVMGVVYDHNGVCLLVKQTRWGMEKETIEFPCGTVEEGEDPKDALIREIKEETGISCPSCKAKLILSTNPNPAYFNNRMHIYSIKCRDLLKRFNEREKQNLDENEDCKVLIDYAKNYKEEISEHAIGALAFNLIFNNNWRNEDDF